MSLRIYNLVVLGLLVSACGAGETPEPEGDAIACAIGPGAELSEVCTLEILPQNAFVIHHPDGGFRRFVRDDEGAIAEADGAARLDIDDVPNQPDETVEFRVDGDLYRLPSASINDVTDE